MRHAGNGDLSRILCRFGGNTLVCELDILMMNVDTSDGYQDKMNEDRMILSKLSVILVFFVRPIEAAWSLAAALALTMRVCPSRHLVSSQK